MTSGHTVAAPVAKLGIQLYGLQVVSRKVVIEFHPGLAKPLEMARLCLEGIRGISF